MSSLSPLLLNLHVAPQTGAHVAAWPSCHVAAPLCASCAAHPGSATWPQCRVAPRGGPARHVSRRHVTLVPDVSFSCVVKTQRRWSNKIYKTELTKTRYNNRVLGKYQVDQHRAGLTLIAELTSSNLGLKGVLNKRK